MCQSHRLIEARHSHGINTGDKVACVRKIVPLFAYLNHTNALITELNFCDLLMKRCLNLSKIERLEAHVLYSQVIGFCQ